MKSSRAIFAMVVAFVIAFLVWLGWGIRREHRFDDEIRVAAAKYGLSPALVKAVVWQESAFHSQARGQAGEIGLMQLTETAGQEWADSERQSNYAHESMLDPRWNTMAGSYYLAKVLKRYSKTDLPLAFALADYNAGRTHVLRWMKEDAVTNSTAFLKRMDYPGTRRYITRILQRYEHYRPEFEK